MTSHDSEERREKSPQRRIGIPAMFPLFDSDGEPVIWNRRKTVGRRKSDRKPLWNRDDLAGLALMGIMLVILVLAVWYLWMNNFLLTN